MTYLKYRYDDDTGKFICLYLKLVERGLLTEWLPERSGDRTDHRSTEFKYTQFFCLVEVPNAPAAMKTSFISLVALMREHQLACQE